MMTKVATVEQTNGVIVICSWWCTEMLWVIGKFAAAQPDTAADADLGDCVLEALHNSQDHQPRPTALELEPRLKRQLKLAKVTSRAKYMRGARNVQVEFDSAGAYYTFEPTRNDGRGYEHLTKHALHLDGPSVTASQVGAAVREALTRCE